MKLAWGLAMMAGMGTAAMGICASAQTTAKATGSYRISGVATSSRDGAPVPFCMLHLERAEAAVQVGSGPRSGGSPGGRFGPGNGRGGRFDPRSGGNRAGRRDTGRLEESAAAQDESVTADAQGRFSLEAPGPGAWLLTGMARGFHSQAYEAHDLFASAIVLTAAQPAARVDFQMAADATIAGGVLDEAGEGIAGAQVQAEAAEDEGGTGARRVLAFGQTDDRGRYELAALAPGPYRVRVEARPWYATGGTPFGGALVVRTLDGARPQASVEPVDSLDPSLDVVYPETWFPGVDDAGTAEVLRLASGEVRQADFHLQAVGAARLVLPRPELPAGSLTGSAQDRGGWSGPLVSRETDDETMGMFGSVTGSTRAGNGSWEVTGLAPGTYLLRMPGADGQPGTDVEEFTVRPGAAGTVDLGSAKPMLRVGITFAGADAGRTDVTLTEVAAGTDVATGRRFSSTGGGLSFRRREESEPRGRSVLVPAGEYRVSVSGSDTAYLTGISAVGAKVHGDQTHGDRVSITDAGATLTLELADGRGELDGVAAEGVKPVGAAMVLLVPATPDAGNLAGRTARDETNSDGSFELRGVVPGPYILVVVKDGWGVNWRDPATLASLLLHGVPVQLKPGARMKVEVQAMSL